MVSEPVFKCFISLRFSSFVHFISHSVPSSFNAFFERLNELINFLEAIHVFYILFKIEVIFIIVIRLKFNNDLSHF
jgi:hypothetical protein